ncbi:helicase-associated domain-containing protein [Tomitella biformata]|uniref:helicase-associated domain-containing protein n=1 Tax=Tomitella biformata TaxID=630403 RepID=UPI0005710BEA|nr:helicase-associated domain-containing protein [Tomitella biformata]
MPKNLPDPSPAALPSAPNLADWLRGRSDAELARLLGLRPDLTVQPPRTTQVLATRAEQRMSVHRVAGELDTLAMGVLEVLILQQADVSPVSADLVRTDLLEHASAPAVDAALGRLRDLALVWGDDQQLSMTPAAREILPWSPGHLVDPPASDTGTPAELRTAIAGLDGNQRALLETLARGSGVGRTRDAAPEAAASSPVQTLLRVGLLNWVDDETVQLPEAVRAILAGAPLRGELRLTEPTVPTVKNKIADVDAAAAGQAMELLRHSAAVLDELSRAPVPTLRTGGVGVRELRRLAKATGLAEPALAFVLELLAHVGLIATGIPDPAPLSDTADSYWAPTDIADHWLAQTPANRWAALAAPWLGLARKVWTIGGRDTTDKLIPALSPDLASATAQEDRRVILELLADVKPGSAIAAPDLLTLLRWRRPRRHGRMPLHLVEHFLSEAAAIGAVGRGALSTPGRALLAPATETGGAPTVATAMSAAMPAPIDHVLLQADLTMIAPGPLTPELQARVEQVAEVESAGAATVYRITEQSLRGALDAGNSPTELHELFAQASRTPVPQGLTYLIDDVARRHGQLRVGYANAFLRCEDPGLLAEVLARLPELGLRRLAPTVAISHLDLAPLLAELRGAGLAAVGEDESGSIVDLRPRGSRVPPPRQSRAAVHRPPSPTASAEQLADVVSGLRAGDQAAVARSSDTVRVDGTKARGAATVSLLQTATQVGRAVAVGYVDAKGTAIHRIVDPVRFDSGQLEARDTVTGEVLKFSLHRITSVALVE